MPVNNGNYIPPRVSTLDVYSGEGRVSRILDRVEMLKLVDKQIVTVFDFDTIYVTGNARLTAFGTAGTVYASNEAEVLVHGDITVIAVDSAKVHAYDRVRAVINGNSQAVFHHSSRGTIRDQAVATFLDASTGSAHNMSKVEAHDTTRVSAYDMASVTVHGTYGGVRARGAAVVTVTDGYPEVVAESANVKVHVPAGAAERQPDGSVVAYRNVVGAATILTGPAPRPEDQTLQVPAGARDVAYQQGGSAAEDRALAGSGAGAPAPSAVSASGIVPAAATAPVGADGPRHQAPGPAAPSPAAVVDLTGGEDPDEVVSITAMRDAGQSIFGQGWTAIVPPPVPVAPTSLPE